MLAPHDEECNNPPSSQSRPAQNGRATVCSAQSPSLLLSSLAMQAHRAGLLEKQAFFQQFAPCSAGCILCPFRAAGWQLRASRMRSRVGRAAEATRTSPLHAITTGRQRYSLRVADRGRQAGVPWQKGSSPLHAHRIFILRGKAVAIAHRSRSFITTTMAPVVLGRSIHEAAWLDCVDRG